MIFFLGLGVVILIAIGIVFIKLPSVASLGQKLSTKKSQVPVASASVAPPVSQVERSESTVEAESSVASADATSAAGERSTEAKLLLLEDFIDPNKPLSDFCNYLQYYKNSPFKSNQEVDQALDESVLSENKDPRLQAVKPVFRYMMRLPKLNKLIREAQSAGPEGEETILKKADFYAKVFTAFQEVQAHQGDLESIIDRTYFYMGLNNLIAAKPELMNDARIHSYCSGVEQSFNQAEVVRFSEEKRQFLNLLSDLNVNPADIQFDPAYKSQIEFKLNPSNIGLEGKSWLEQIFKNPSSYSSADQSPAEVN